MDTKQVKINAVEEMEEPEEVSTSYDKIWVYITRGKKDLGKNEQILTCC